MQARNQNKTEFSERVERLAEHWRIPLRDVGEKLGISTAQLFAYRSGKAPLSLKAWGKLEAAETNAGLSDAMDIAKVPHHGSTPLAEELIAGLRKKLEALIVDSEGLAPRLHWIDQQMNEHLTTPRSWKSPALRGVGFLPQGSLPSHGQSLSAETGKPLRGHVPRARAAS